MDDGSQKNSEQLSEQALVVYRAMYEQISAIKKCGELKRAASDGGHGTREQRRGRALAASP
jgi:hypothetical protein